jgi:hypothetical protein
MLLLLSCLAAVCPSLAGQPSADAPAAPAASANALESSPLDSSFDRSLFFQAPPASAAGADKDEAYPNMYRKFGLNLGFAAFANFNTEFAVNSGGAGTILDMEDVLGLEKSSNVGRLDGFWAFGPRGSLNFSYFDIRRSGSRTVNQDITWGDINIPAGSQVNSKFNTQIIKLDYRYNFVADQRTTIAASIGLHVMTIDAALDANALSLAESFKVAAPLPLLGLHWAYALSPTWKLTMETQILQMDIGSYRGYVRDARLSLDDDLFDNFGWGIGLNSFTINGHAEGDNNLSADLKYGYEGVMVYLRWYM